MADQYGIPMSASPKFNENILGQHFPHTGAFGFHLQPPHFGPNSNHQARTSSSKRPVGRPLGAKNKPKPPIITTQENNYDMIPTVIEVGAGTDVVEEVVQLARRRNAGIIVLHAAGIISTVTVCHPLGQAPTTFTLHGPFSVLGLCGSYLTAPDFGLDFPAYLPLFIPNLPPSSIHPTFEICLSDFQGNDFSGNVAGKVVAGNSGVTVTALLFNHREYHNFGIFSAGNMKEEDIDNSRHSGGGGRDYKGASGSGGGSNASGFGMPNFRQY